MGENKIKLQFWGLCKSEGIGCGSCNRKPMPLMQETSYNNVIQIALQEMRCGMTAEDLLTWLANLVLMKIANNKANTYSLSTSIPNGSYCICMETVQTWTMPVISSPLRSTYGEHDFKEPIIKQKILINQNAVFTYHQKPNDEEILTWSCTFVK